MKQVFRGLDVQHDGCFHAAVLVRSAEGQVARSGVGNAAIASRCSLTSLGTGRQRQRGLAQHLGCASFAA